MKKYLLFLFLILGLVSNGYGSPNNSMSITPAAVDATTITASDENSRNNEVSTKFNVHDHNDIDQTANTLAVGDAAAGNKTVQANNADTNKPFLRFDDTNNYWIFSDNGVAPSVVIHGNALIFEGTTDDAYETTLSITDPTADRTQTIQNNAGIIPLGTAGNTLFFTTTGATDVTLPTSGTLGAGDMSYADTRFEMITFTRDMATASGTQVVSLVTSRTPKQVIFFVSEGTGAVTGEMSIGFDNGTSAWSIEDYHNTTANTWVKNSADISIACIVDATKSYYGEITTLASGSFTITWTKNGSPTGTITIYALVFF